MRKNILAAFSLALAVVGCGNPNPGSGVQEAWNRANDPFNFSYEYERTLKQLPLAGELDETPWTDFYWPSYQGGIANRWIDPRSASAFGYALINKRQLDRMSRSDLAKLSPAEKYDIYMGRYDFPTVLKERGRTSPENETWEGICHGWAAAAYNFAEPKPVVVRSVHGIDIPFGSSDVKALLSYYQGQESNAPAISLGDRCNVDLSKDPRSAMNPECRDTNAGAFHIVLTNQIGLMKKSFVAEVTRDLQVWNHPVYKFAARIVREQAPSRGAARGTVKEVVVETSMTYTVEIEPEWDAVNGSNRFAADTKTYEYRLEVDRLGDIIGGEWITEDRPDFLWSQEAPKFTGYFKGVKEIYEASVAPVAE